MFKFLKSLIRSNSGDSSKSFGLVISAVVGAILGLVVAFVLVWDVTTNGHVDTDLGKLGTLVLCIGAYTFGSGANKMLSEVAEDKAELRAIKKYGKTPEEQECYEELDKGD